MNQSAPLFTHRIAHAPTENVHRVAEQPPSLAEGGRKKQQSQQPRQLLSCTKCRERKVKCDRTKPCSACCARGQPKECYFVAEGGDYAPIQQSYELRKLRSENLRLKERLRANKLSIEDDEAEFAGSPGSPHDGPATKAFKRRTARQRRFQGGETADSIYFGSPGLANVINEFASINVTPITTQSLTHAMPRGADMYAPKDLPLYPFATLFSWSLEDCIPELLGCLPPEPELYGYLETFQERVHVCFFPHMPTEITRSEVERFLSDSRKNADGCPEMLALLFAALALGSQHCVWDKSGGQWVTGAVEEESLRGNLYIAAAMQALRMASFMNRPNLLGIQALIMIGPYLTNSGRFLDAWTLFGTTIRLAQSIGLHRHPKYLDPAPPTLRECSIRQTVWWWMLHMDQQYSMTLGRPLGISGIGDCPPPHELTTNPTFLRFGDFVHQFTLLARQILSSDRPSNAKIDEFTDSLRGLLDTMPEQLQFNETWLRDDVEIPEWPLGAMAAVFYCKTHNYLILLNRQRLDHRHSGHPSSRSRINKSPPPSFHPVNSTACSSPTASGKASIRGRSLVLSSSEDLLTAFLFFYSRVPAALICWTVGQQAFNSCMILILDALETGDLSRIWKVEKAYVVFTELDRKGVHKLANLAVERVSWGLSELKKMQDDAAAGRKSHGGALKRGDQMRGDTQMQGAVGNEAMPCSGMMHDTVMGNTGMLLLEDPGLQSFVPEAFTPLTWVMAGSELEGASPIQLKQEEAQRQGQRGLPESRESPTRSNQIIHTARSSGELQGVQTTHGSTPGSAPIRYATFPTAPSQEHHQPQGLTSPTSPISATTSQVQHRDRGPPITKPPITKPPPHLRHNSFPALHHHIPHHPPIHLKAALHQQLGNINANVTGHTKSSTATYFDPAGVSSSLRSGSEAATGHPSVHPPWAARPALAPMCTISEPALSFPHLSNRTHAFPAEHQYDMGSGPPYTFPPQLSSSGNADRLATVGVEQIDFGWLGGSSGAG